MDAIHDGTLAKASFTPMEVFGVGIPSECNGVPSEILHPKRVWKSAEEYNEALRSLATLFKGNFEKYSDRAAHLVEAGVKLE